MQAGGTRSTHTMKLSHKPLAAASLAAALLCGALAAPHLLPARAQDDPEVAQPNPLPTGKSITLPPKGTQQNVGSLPMNMILAPGGKYALVSDMGFRESLSAIDAQTGQRVSEITFNSTLPSGNLTGLYYGLAAHDNGNGTSTVYAAQGGANSIAVLSLSAGGSLVLTGTIPAAQSTDFPAGIALDNRGYLYVANNDPDTFAVPGSVSVYNLNASPVAEVGRYAFTQSGYGTPNFPLAVATLQDGSRVYVSSQRDGTVYALNCTDPTHPALAASLPTGGHPDGLLLTKDQSRLYVANANSDTVSVVSAAQDKVINTVLLRPAEARGLPGASPTGLGLSQDETTLYVSLGDMNAVGVVDTAAGQVKGYIPTGWYPSAVIAPGSGRLLVANAKGTQTRNPNPTYSIDPSNPTNLTKYDEFIIEGNVSSLPVPSAKTLAADTEQVLANNRYAALANTKNPLAAIGLKAGQITHVIYIVKENRTYDQVLGDIPQGNGDPSITLFGQAVTPNLHRLANRFVLLDNFYDCGEVSGDGWNWSTQSYANEQVIKNLPYNYSGRGRNYDFEGQNNGYPAGGFAATDPNGQPNSAYFPNGAPAITDISRSPNGHIWDAAEQAGLAYRNYGFFYTFGVSQNGVNIIPDNYPAAPGLLPPGHNLAGKSDFDFRRFDGLYADSDAPRHYGVPYPIATYGKYNMPSRFDEFNREFQKMLAADPTGKGVPALMTVRLMNDHTLGFRAGVQSPRAHVADNDYGVGQLVEAISKSAIWKHTAIFVIEDDAQDGPDHVDCHRSTCYVASPWIKAHSVDHTFYNTDSVLRTMEDLLGLAPLSQYDGIAPPIMDFDTSPRNSGLYQAVLPAKAIITEINPSGAALQASPEKARMARLSAQMDLTHPDSAPAGPLNDIIWKSVKGVHSVMPAPRRTLLAARKGGDD